MHPQYHLAIALLPLALYLLWQGAMSLRLRPRWISGTANTIGVAWALLGLAVVGPLPVFLPTHAIQRFNVLIWWMVLALYILVTILIVLLSRPHAFVANITREALKPLIADIVMRLDSRCTWAGDSVCLPQLGLEFRLEPQPFFKVIYIQALGAQPNMAAWDQFQRELRAALRPLHTGVNPWGWSLIFAGAALVGGLYWQTHDFWANPDAMPQMVTKIFRELLAL
jgi:hypothetical protein